MNSREGKWKACTIIGEVFPKLNDPVFRSLVSFVRKKHWSSVPPSPTVGQEDKYVLSRQDTAVFAPKMGYPWLLSYNAISKRNFRHERDNVAHKKNSDAHTLNCNFVVRYAKSIKIPNCLHLPPL